LRVGPLQGALLVHTCDKVEAAQQTQG
jgi:hypothetical protein